MTERRPQSNGTGLHVAHPRIDLQVTLSRAMIATRGCTIAYTSYARARILAERGGAAQVC